MFGGVFDPDAIDKSIKEKELLTQASDFWDNHEEAEKVMAQIRKLKNRIEPWKLILKDLDDLETMYELAEESNDSGDEEEVQKMYSALKEKFDKQNILKPYSIDSIIYQSLPVTLRQPLSSPPYLSVIFVFLSLIFTAGLP